MNAVFNDNEDCAVALALKHAETGVSSDTVDHLGKTPLMMAVVKGHRDLTSCLLETGADSMRVDGASRNVLHYACMHGSAHAISQVIQRLSPQQRAVLLEQRDANGLTPRDQLDAAHDEDLLSAPRMSEDGKHELQGRFEAEFSIWPGRLESDSCDMDRSVGGSRTLKDAVIAQRRDLQTRFDELVGA
jgi:hypothetical protein